MPTSLSTPQRLGGGRILLGKQRRAAAVRRHARVARAEIASLTTLPKATDAIVAAKTQLGLPYGITGCRCSPQPCRRRDCSGEIYYGINVVSGTNLCGSSFGLAQIGLEHGTIIAKEVALVTPGAIGVRNPWGSPNAIGSNGHTWWCEGDGEHSIEEGGRRTGCYRGQADKDSTGFCIYMLWPGFDYSHATPQEIDMMLQLQHYDLSTGHPSGEVHPTRAGEDPCIRISSDGKRLECWWGASIANDQRFNADLRWWVPIDGFPPGSTRIVSVTPRAASADDVHPGGVVQFDNGLTHRFRLS